MPPDLQPVEAATVSGELRAERNRRKREQRKRQRDRLQRQLAERTGERGRARRDRRQLADWIDQHLPDVQVNRTKSGQWTVELRSGEIVE